MTHTMGNHKGYPYSIDGYAYLRYFMHTYMAKLFTKFRGYLVLIAIVVIAVVGAYWYQDYLKYNTEEPVEVQEFVTWVDRGMDSELAERYALEIAELEAAITEQGDDPDLADLLQLGNKYYAIVELGKAKETYGKILLISPTDVPTLENLGTTLVEMEDYYGAEEAWVLATELAGNESHVLRLADLIDYYIPEHKDRVGPMLQLAIQELGQSPGLLARLGEWYYEQGDYERAASHYDVAIDLDPEDQSLKDRVEEIRDAWTRAVEEGRI